MDERVVDQGEDDENASECHHGLDLPTTSIALDKLYGEPNDENKGYEGLGGNAAFEIYAQAPEKRGCSTFRTWD